MKEIIETLISDYLVYFLLILLVISVSVGLIANLDKIRNNDKTIRDEGIMGMLYVAGGILIVVFILGFAFTQFKGALEGWNL